MTAQTQTISKFEGTNSPTEDGHYIDDEGMVWKQRNGKVYQFREEGVGYQVYTGWIEEKRGWPAYYTFFGPIKID